MGPRKFNEGELSCPGCHAGWPCLPQRSRSPSPDAWQPPAAGAAKADHQSLQPDPAGVQSAGLERHEGARPRREERLRARHQGLSVDLRLLRGLRHRRDRCADRRTDDPAEALSGGRAASHHRHRLHAVRPRDLRQGPGDQVAGRPQGQAARDRHGRLAIPGRADLRQLPRASTSARTSPWSTPTSPSRAPNWRPAGSMPRW